MNAHIPPPFVIWTLQRTGGTQLTHRLIELSGLLAAPNEPFNESHVYGQVTKAWTEKGDAAALKKAMTEIAQRGEVIKHSVERVSSAVNRALAEATAKAGYRHLFLYREQSLDRLLALYYSHVRATWIKKKGDRPLSMETVAKHPLPAAQLVANEQRGVMALNDVWNHLQSLGQAPSAVSYEAVHSPSDADVKTALGRLLKELGIVVPGDRMRELPEELRGTGSEADVLHGVFPNVDELADALVPVRGFVPVPEPVSCAANRAKKKDAPWVRFASVEAQGALVPRLRRIEGVVVLVPGAPERLQLVLRSGEREWPVPWAIRSTWAEQKYPDSPNRTHARYSVAWGLPDGPAELVLVNPATGERQSCLTLFTTAPEAEVVIEAALGLQAEQPHNEPWAAALLRTLDHLPVALRDARWRLAREACLPMLPWAAEALPPKAA